MTINAALISTLERILRALDPESVDSTCQRLKDLMASEINPLIRDLYKALPAGPDYAYFDVQKYYQLLHLVAQISLQLKRMDKELIYSLLNKEFIYRLLKGLELILRQNLHLTTQQEVTNLLWSLASFSPYEQCNSDEYALQAKIDPVLVTLKEQLLDRIIARSDELSARDFAGVLWALATLGYECSDKCKTWTLTDFFNRHVDDLNEAGLSDVIFCMAKLGIKWTDLNGDQRKKMLQAIGQKIEKKITTEQFSIMLWGLACMGATWKDLGPIHEVILEFLTHYENDFSQLSINQLMQVKALGFPLVGEWGVAVVQSSQSEFEKSILKRLTQYFATQDTEVTLSTDMKLFGVYQPDISVLSPTREPLVHIECDGALHYFRGNSQSLIPTTVMRNTAYEYNKIPLIAVPHWMSRKKDWLELRMKKYLPKKESRYPVYQPPVAKTSPPGSRRRRAKEEIITMPERLCSRLYDLREKTGGVDNFSDEMSTDLFDIINILSVESVESAKHRVTDDGAKSSSYFIDVVRKISDKIPVASKSELFENIFKCFQSEFVALQGANKNTSKIVINFLLALGEMGITYDRIPQEWFDYLQVNRISEQEMRDLFLALRNLGCSGDMLTGKFREFSLASLMCIDRYINLKDIEILVSCFIQLGISSVELPREFLEVLRETKKEASLDKDSPLLQYVIDESVQPVVEMVPKQKKAPLAQSDAAAATRQADKITVFVPSLYSLIAVPAAVLVSYEESPVPCDSNDDSSAEPALLHDPTYDPPAAPNLPPALPRSKYT